ncbi:MAG: HD domain-containing protein [Acidobacteria bacterium]|jgi:(p)ppGpp synthase/HD superfamily hydrolase|nr:HD domain-containing protein [Acidobacteriota bacterium]
MFSFTARIHEAIDTAARAHEDQARKDRDRHIPYVAHVFGVACLLAEFGFDEDIVIAGLLHDVLEDRPHFAAEVEQFGARVAGLVRVVTERKRDEAGNERPWAVRKEEYIERLRMAPPEAKAVSCADKIHNMQSILLALDRGGSIWHELKASPEKQVDRMRRLRAALAEGWQHPILDRFDAILGELERRVRP